MLTYKQARQIHLTDLASMGWTVSDRTLKVPHATSPCGRYRLWYKAQAVHYTTGVGHALKDARAIAYTLDIRAASVHRVINMMTWGR